MGIAALAIAGTLAGAGASIYGAVSKGSPPSYTPISPAAEQNQAITGNLASLPIAEQVTGSANQFSIDQVQKMLAQVIPGYNNITSNVTGNINSLLEGNIPQDVQQQVQGSDAARALTGGFGGSGLAGNLTARDLGLTSLNLTEQGVSSAQSWLSTMANINEPAMMNVSSMFLNPTQVANFDAGQATQQYQSQLTQYNAPNASSLIGNGLQSLGGFGLGLLEGSGGSLFGNGSSLTSVASGLNTAAYGEAIPAGNGDFMNTVGPGGAGSNESIDFSQLISQGF